MFNRYFVVLASEIENIVLFIISLIGLKGIKSERKFWKGFRKFLWLEIVWQGFQWVFKAIRFVVDPEFRKWVLYGTLVVYVDEDD